MASNRKFILLTAAALACGDVDECANLPTSFQLDLVLIDPTIGSNVAFVAISLTAGERRWRRRFAVIDEFDDGETSLAVTVSPDEGVSIELSVDVAALDVSTATIAKGTTTATASPNGCNRFSVSLR